MKNTLLYLRRHFPYLIGLVLIVTNSLVDSGVIHLSDPITNTVNAALAALGLGILHRRQLP